MTLSNVAVDFARERAVESLEVVGARTVEEGAVAVAAVGGDAMETGSATTAEAAGGGTVVVVGIGGEAEDDDEREEEDGLGWRGQCLLLFVSFDHFGVAECHDDWGTTWE